MTSNIRMRQVLLLTVGYLLLTWAINVLGRHAIDPATAFRLNGMLTGAWLIGWANAMPKRLVPLEDLACDPARDQRLRRVAAWALVLGGLGYMLAFVLAPIAIAAPLAAALLAPSVLLVAGLAARCAWRRRAAR